MEQEKMPTVKFSKMEDFIIRTESKESPMDMLYVFYNVAAHDNGERANDIVEEGLKEVFNEASLFKVLVRQNPTRHFLRSSWARDSYLCFNDVYFPFRWIDHKGQNRPEREAYVLSQLGKDDLNPQKVFRRMLTQRENAMFAIGEGGLYVPDHTHKNLFISDGIVVENGVFDKNDHYQQIEDLHKKIFGQEINVCILPCPDNTPHLDTHVSIIPETKFIMIDGDYYDNHLDNNCSRYTHMAD